MANSLHEEVLEFFLEYKKKHPEFVFWLRESDTSNRLTDGFWFQGNEKYAFVGLYTASGGINKTRSVGLVFWYNNSTGKIGVHAEVVFRGE